MTELTVALHGEIIGTLQGERGEFDFRAAAEAIRRLGLNSRALSVAVPLLPRPSAARREARRNFFAELLPEGDARERLANEARLRKDDVMGLLAAYGRDVAGAVQIWDPTAPGEPRTPRLEPLDDAGVRTMLQSVSAAPLGNRPRSGKTSLPGVQQKIVLVRTADGWARALDGWPSTHIVKPMVAKHPSMIFDEEYGSRFARALDLAAFSTDLQLFDDVPGLVIERYDRDPASPDGRVHQEDFSQALGLAGDQKYERYGHTGVRAIQTFVDGDDAARVLRMLTLSVAVGNLDLHMKNFSLLHLANDLVHLAPMYDVVPQHFIDGTDGEMALRIGGEFEHRVLTRDHLAAAGAELGVAETDDVIRTTLEVVRDVAAVERPHVAAHPGLQSMISEMATNLLDGKTVMGELPGTANSAGRGRGTGAWRWDNPVHPQGE